MNTENASTVCSDCGVLSAVKIKVTTWSAAYVNSEFLLVVRMQPGKWR